MMINIYDVLTGEKIKSFEDSEVKPAIEAARAAGKIVNQELDDTRKDVQIFVLREEPLNRDIYTAETAAALERFTEAITKAAQQFRTTVLPTLTTALAEVADIASYIEEALGSRPPETIKRELKHEKNPMRQKQLQKELNEAYKAHKRHKERRKKDGSI